MQLEIGKIVEGTVTGITKFGAFVDLGEGKTGMVHISEVAPTYVKEITDYLTQGQTVKVRILSIALMGKSVCRSNRRWRILPRIGPAVPVRIPVTRTRDTGKTVLQADLRLRRTAALPMRPVTGTVCPKTPGARILRICSRNLWRAAMRKFPTSSAIPTVSAGALALAAAVNSRVDVVF